jgi:hypothetical protein
MQKYLLCLAQMEIYKVCRPVILKAQAQIYVRVNETAPEESLRNSIAD